MKREDLNYKSNLYQYINSPPIFESIVSDIFKVADRDGNGTIDKEEFTICMNQVAEGFGIKKPSNTIIDETYKMYDKDKNGIIDYEEFKLYIKYILNKIIDLLS